MDSSCVMTFAAAFRKSLLLAAMLLVAAAPARADNPFGVMLWPQQGDGLEMTLARARGLGVAWFRPPTLYLDRWDGTCPDCGLYVRSGLKLALVVRNGGEDQPTRRPAVVPADLAAYRARLAKVLEAWHPAVLVVEASENDPQALTGLGDDFSGYIAELGAACAVAHAHGAYCTNGGLTSTSIAAAAWLDLLRRGLPDQACDFAKRAFYVRGNPDAGAPLCTYRRRADVPPRVAAAALAGAGRLLALYRGAAIDVVNVHWFIHDARALSQTVDFVQRTTGKPVVSTEIGQWRWDADPNNVRPLLRAAFAADMKLVIWYSLENGHTASLFEPDGRLRPAGWEFQRQMWGK